MSTAIQKPLSDQAPLAEILLAEAAVGVELPPSWHAKAVQRYEAVRKFIERPESPLADKVNLFYPQGSMAIGATIRSRKRDTGYDIDIVAELDLPFSTPETTVLNTLYEAIKGKPGSRYHDKVERQTRCITIHYEDGMHLDVSPSILLDPNDPRKSWIFHAKPEDPITQHKRITVNSYRFANWFNERTPADFDFAESYRLRALSRDQGHIFSEAEAEPVPDHSSEAGGKSITVVALQLLKRNRNINYASRETIRMPPSVLLSCIAAEAAPQTTSIGDSLDAISKAILVRLESADHNGKLLDVRNPMCNADSFTDRWPENILAQKQFIADLYEFRDDLHRLRGEGTLNDKQKILSKMFGEDPSHSVIDRYAQKAAGSVSKGQRSVRRTGRAVIGAGASANTNSKEITPRNHTFFGGSWN